MATPAAAKQSALGNAECADGEWRPDATQHDEAMYESILQTATNDPGLLALEDTKCLARVICSKAVRASATETEESIAILCVSIMSKPGGRLFADVLQDSMHQWFQRREELLPRRLAGEGKAPEEPRYKWTRFVRFSAELLLAMTGAGWDNRGHRWYWRLYDVAVLLCDCLDITLRHPGHDALGEVKCVQSSLVLAGKAAAKAADQHVEDLVVLMRGATTNAKFPPEAKTILRELIDLLR